MCVCGGGGGAVRHYEKLQWQVLRGATENEIGTVF